MPLPEQHTDPSLWDRARVIGGLVASGVCLVGGGAYIGSQIPADAEISPGLTLSSTAQAHGTTIELGPLLGKVNFPEIHYHTPFGNIGADVSVRHDISIDLKDPQALGSYAAIKDDPKRSIQEPLVRAMLENTLTGAGVGLAAEVIGGGLYVRHRKRKYTERLTEQTNQENAQASLDRLREITNENPEAERLIATLRASLAPQTETNTPLYKQRRAWAVCAAGALTLGLIGNLHEPVSTQDPHALALSPAITKYSPLLKGATVSGTAAELLVSTAINQVDKYIATTNNFYTTANKNLVQAFKNLKTKPGDIPLNSPDYVNVLAISDYHCNLAMLQKSFNLIVRSGYADVIANMGDTSVSTGKLPSEQQCTDVMGKAIAPTPAFDTIVPIVAVEGNHDSEITANNERRLTLKYDDKSYKPFVVLDDKLPYARVDGIVFASGANDPRQSVFGSPMTPLDTGDQNKALARQGASIATNACKAREAYSVSPVVMAHGMEATYQSIINNCVSIALSGHLHVQKGPYNYEITSPSGGPSNTEYAFTQGTSGGAGEGQITEYSPVARKEGATYTFFMFDPKTNTPVGYYNLIIGTDASVTLSGFTHMPKAQALSTDIPQFLSTYQ